MIEDGLQISKAEWWWLELSHHISDRIQVLEHVIEIEALDLGFGLHGGDSF